MCESLRGTWGFQSQQSTLGPASDVFPQKLWSDLGGRYGLMSRRLTAGSASHVALKALLKDKADFLGERTVVLLGLDGQCIVESLIEAKIVADDFTFWLGPWHDDRVDDR